MYYKGLHENNTVSQESYPREAALIDRFFGDRIYISIEDAAAILEVDVRTLRDLAVAGRIGFVVAGTGSRRPRRRFTRSHIAGFLRDERTASARAARSGSPNRMDRS